MLKKYLFMLLFLCSAVYSNQTSKSLLQEKATLKQSWLLSRNYAYGLTVEKDPFKALAWQYVYVMLLPHAYPGSYGLLDPYKKKLEKDQYDLAFEYSKTLKRDYNLPSRMDENQLIRVFEAKESQVEPRDANKKDLLTVDDFLEKVQKGSRETAVIYKDLLFKAKSSNKQEQLIYGQVFVNGGQLEQTLVRNQPLMINKDGFFIGNITKDLFLSAKGYQPYQYDFKTSNALTSLGLIVLNKYPKKQLASIVGSILPIKQIKNIALVLQFENQYLDQNQAWLSPSMAVTKLDNGQFYIKGLAPGDYKLILSFDDKTKSVPISVKNGQVKTIKPIKL